MWKHMCVFLYFIKYSQYFIITIALSFLVNAKTRIETQLLYIIGIETKLGNRNMIIKNLSIIIELHIKHCYRIAILWLFKLLNKYLKWNNSWTLNYFKLKILQELKENLTWPKLAILCHEKKKGRKIDVNLQESSCVI